MLKHFNYLFSPLLFVEVFKSARSSCQAIESCFSAIVVSRIIYALPAWGGLLSNDLISKLDIFFSKKLSAGATAVIWDVCLFYCMSTYFIKWLIIRITVFTSYYLRKRLYPWNSGLPITVFLLCLSVILICANVCLYCNICLVMHIRFCM